jgi:hypothetical protein
MSHFGRLPVVNVPQHSFMTFMINRHVLFYAKENCSGGMGNMVLFKRLRLASIVGIFSKDLGLEDCLQMLSSKILIMTLSCDQSL